jgi:Family of unknown function (DUF6527)
MKAKPLKESERGYVQCEPNEATHLQFDVPGPFPNRILPVMIGGTRAGTPNWTWNGSVDLPTVKPSILTRGSDVDVLGILVEHVCHSFINDGKIQFLGDCTHEFAGQTLDLYDVD